MAKATEAARCRSAWAERPIRQGDRPLDGLNQRGLHHG